MKSSVHGKRNKDGKTATGETTQSMGWPPVFPMFLLLQGRKCLVLGGDTVARDKAASLLQAQAQVLLVCQELHPDLARWVAEEKMTLLANTFHPDQLQGVWLVVNTLEDANVRQLVWQETEERRIFLNTVDVHDCCTAYWPAIVSRPPVTVAIGTGGVSPALAGYLRRKIASVLPDSMMPLASWLTQWRQSITRQLPDLSRRASLWQKLMNHGMVEKFLSGDIAGAEEMVRQALMHSDKHS